MTSFWENSSVKNVYQIVVKNSNDSLPSLGNKTHEALLRHASSKTFYQCLPPPKYEDNTSQKHQEVESVHPRVINKKKTLHTIPSRSTYCLVPKNNIEEPPIIELSEALRKIEEIFSRECNFEHFEHKTKLKKNLKTSTSKTSFIRPNSVQNFLIDNPKKQLKKEFDDLIKTFNKADLKTNDFDESIQKVENLRKTQKLIKMLSKSSSIEKGRVYHEENLTQNEKLQLIKQSKTFEKAEKSSTTKMLFYHLVFELYIETGQLEKALNPLYYCEYYARKMDFDQYVIPCLILQAEIKQSLYEPGQSIRILKSALEFSIVKKWKELELRVLEKISMVYYYRGNSYMAKYYKDLSETGLPKSEYDIYLKEYSKSEELKSLEAKIFSLPYEEMNKKKYNDTHELDISRDLYQDHESMIHSHHEEVSSMLRDSKTSKIGIKLRKLIIQNCEKAQVKRYDSQHESPEILPRFIALDYPIENCSQIIKSHLSKSRSALGFQIKNINFIRTFRFLKSLYRRLTYEINQENEGFPFEKENLPSIYS